NQHHSKFFELIKPNHNFDFVGKMNLLLGISLFLVFASIAMLPINHFWRGHSLNYSIDFRGGSEVQVAFAKPEDPGAIRAAMDSGGFPGTDVVTMKDAAHPNTYLLRFGAVSPVSEKKADELHQRLKTKWPDLKKFEFSEGGDKLYVRTSKAI